MKRSVKKVAAVLALAGVAGLSACSAGSESEGEEQPFRVVMIGGQTGASSPATLDAITGLQAAADDINAAGGILGRQVVVDVLDSKSDPAQAVTQLQRLVSSGESVDLVYAGVNSSETLAMLPVLTAEKILSTTSATNDEMNNPAEYPYHFGVSPSNLDALAVLTKEFEGKQTLGLLVPSTAFGDSLVTNVSKIAEDAGLEIVAEERFDPADVDYTVQYQRTLAANPDIIFSDAVGTDVVGRIFEARRLANGMSVPLAAGLGSGTAVPVEIAPTGSTEDCLLPTWAYTVEGNQNPDSLGSVVDYAATSKSGSVNMLGFGYDALRVFQFAVEGAGTTDSDAVSAYLQENEIPANTLNTLRHAVRYSSDSHFPNAADDTLTLIGCDSEVEGGFWIAK